MSPMNLRFVLPSVAALLLAGPSFAQDGAPPAPPAPPAPQDGTPGAPAPSAETLDQLVERMSALQSGVRVRPSTEGLRSAADPHKARVEYAAAKKKWEDDVQRLAETGDRYVAGAASAGAPADPRVVYWAALGHASWADIQAASIAKGTRARAAELLGDAIARAPKDAVWLGEAHVLRGRMLCFALADDPSQLDPTVKHLAAGAEAMLADARAPEAGDALCWAMRSLLAADRSADARELAARFKVGERDFGVYGRILGELATQARTGVGAEFPALPDGTDAAGNPVRFSGLRGKPFLVHFFHAGWPTGYPSEERDVETVLRPLWDDLKGAVPFVGVSMDFEMPRARAEEVKANFDEWGVKHAVHDGSAGTVAAWAESQGVAWPYIRTGKWIDDPYSLALGGCGRNEAHAILVGADGKIAWRGRAPFTGLAEAVRKAAGK